MNIQPNLPFAHKVSDQNPLRGLLRFTNSLLDWYEELSDDVRRDWHEQGIPSSVVIQMDGLWEKAETWFFTHRNPDHVGQMIFNAQKTIVYATFFPGNRKRTRHIAVKTLPI